MISKPPINAKEVPSIPAIPESAGSEPPAEIIPKYIILIVAPMIVPCTGFPKIIPITRPDTIGRLIVAHVPIEPKGHAVSAKQ